MKYLLPNLKKYHKACLHAHSNISDGKLSPEEVKAEYKKKGYSILALTDHELCFAHPELNDEEFLTLTGYELMVYDEAPRMNVKTYHLNMIAKEADNRWQFYQSGLRPYMDKFSPDQLVFDSPQVYRYDLGEINRIIAKANEKGFLVLYNHPVWSLQDGRDYRELVGIWGVEVFNYGSYKCGFEEDMSQCYQELLKAGIPVVPVASDDSHRYDDIGGGWVMVGAERLAYGDVINALEKGDFYATAGPEIHSLTVDGDKVRILCSEAGNINFVTHGRLADRVFPREGKPLTEAEFDLSQWKEKITEDWKEKAFFRICVTDKTGKKAYTRAYRLRDLEE